MTIVLFLIGLTVLDIFILRYLAHHPNVFRRIVQFFRRKRNADEDIQVLVGEEEPLKLEKEDKEMIESIVTFGQTTVKEVMTPRIDMICVPANTLVSDVLEKTISQGFSKFPVYQENIDTIVGIVYVKDLLRFIRDGRMNTPIREQLRKPHVVPESKKVDDLLREMQKEKISMAIVLDEYGGTEGLVTIEDLVEEIVGEIDDEHDRQLPDLLEIEKGSWLVDGQMNLEDLNEAIGTAFPTEEFETLGGYFYGLTGKIPRPADKIETPEGTLEAAVVSGQRISKLKFTQKKEVSSRTHNDG